MNRVMFAITSVLTLNLPAMVFSQGTWQTYIRTNGLASDSVVCITQDRSGNYWIGTYGNGLSKLDTNGVWTGFMNGDSFVVIKDIEFDSLNNKWLSLAQLGGYYAGGTYVVKFDDSTFTYYSPTWSPYYDPKPTCLGKDSSGHIWCGTTGGVAFWFDDGDWHEAYLPGLWGGSWNWINEIKADHNGKLYFAHDQGISTLEKGLFGAYMTGDIDFDRQNYLWFGSYDFDWPLGMFDGEKWHAFTLTDGLAHSWVSGLAIDSCNNIWICYGSGPRISKFDGKNFIHFYLPKTAQGGDYDHLGDIYVDHKGEIWFTSYQGVLILKDTTTTGINPETISHSNETYVSLLQNYPNPFNSRTSITYNLNKTINIELSIYNIKGEEVITPVREDQSSGWHQVSWNGTDKYGEEVSSGIYIAFLKNNHFKKSIKLTLIR